MLVYMMVLAQGVLGYGLTSILGAVVVEIFQGKHYGSIFGSVMLAALAEAPRAPGSPACCTTSGEIIPSRLRSASRERIVGIRDLDGVTTQNSRGRGQCTERRVELALPGT